MAERRYQAAEVEAKWQARWEASGAHHIDLDSTAEPYYNLTEFPYPSGEGLHVGHVYTYAGADTYGRLRRMQGYNVFQPMGFDAFGIHTENFALDRGIHPADLAPANIARFRSQLRSLGFQFDFGREVITSNPDYYRWTQWLFLQLYRGGLAYRAKAPVNWCPSCQTVLANEQVVAGCCERCTSPTTQRELWQWFLRITAYADRLLDFSQVLFPESSVKNQTAWIGRREGVEVDFGIVGTRLAVTIFTTRPEMLCGATFVALAPEHPLVDSITTPAQREAVTTYCAQAKRKLERERQAGEASGVFTGAYAVHPITDEAVPIWLADFVLPSYGSGAIMGVPDADARDAELAARSVLPTRPVLVAGRLVDSLAWSGLSEDEARPKMTAWLVAKGRGRAKVSYRLRDWLISRQRYWGPPIPMVYCPKCGIVPVPERSLPVVLPRLEQWRPTGTAPLAASEEFVACACPRCRGAARRETDVSDNFLDSSWYFLRYLSPERRDVPWDRKRVQRWLPVDHYAGGPEHTTMHHLYARFITLALHDLGLLPFEEPFARLRLHGTITKDGAKMSKSRGNVIVPDEYVADCGADVFRMAMLFTGPWDEGGDFNDRAVGGVQRFVQRVWELFEAAPGTADPVAEEGAEHRRHQVIRRVEEALDGLKFHLAIATLMETVGWLREERGSLGEGAWLRWRQTLARLLAPLAPHLAEELWERLGGQTSVHRQQWPHFEPSLAAERVAEVVVQVDGKLRARLSLPRESTPADLERAALAHPRVREALGGQAPARIVQVPGRLLNIVRNVQPL